MQVEINHDYYTSGKLLDRDLKLFTLPSTKKIFDNYRLILKQNANVLEVIQECLKQDGGVEPLVRIDSELEFNFVLKQQNKKFFNITETQYPDMRREVFFFTNKKKNKIHEKGFLSKEEFISSKDIEKIENLNYKNALKTGGVVALISLNINEMADKAIESGEPYKYDLKFLARKVFWQYELIKKYNKIEKAKIIDDSKAFKFPEVKESAEEGKRVFVSDKKISLKQLNSEIFKLVMPNGRQGMNKTLYEKLPYPKIANIGKHPFIENEFIAKINIYI